MTSKELENLLSAHGIHRIQRRGDNLFASCPNSMAHSRGDQRPSWGISTNEPHKHGCFGCGFKGTLRSLLIFLGVSPKRALILSGEKEVVRNFPLSLIAPAAKAESRITVLPEEELFPYFASKRSDAYLRLVRGLSLKTIRAANLLWDRARNRVVVPWYFEDKLVFVTGRTLNPVEARTGAKVLSYFPNLKKSEVVYLPNRRIEHAPLIVVEGEFDALRLYDQGFTNVAALGQARLSDAQRDLLLNSAATAFVAFGDRDRAGERLNAELNEKLSHYPFRAITYPQGCEHKDPGEMPAALLRKLISSAPLLTLGTKN